MRISDDELLLYAVTDRRWAKEKTLLEQIEEALKGGVTLVQLREKELGYDEFLEEAKKAAVLCHSYNVKLIINDNIDVALKSGADGVHVGQSDMPVKEIRKIAGDKLIVGTSAKTVEAARRAEEDGADYLGVGACFGTSTKGDAGKISLDVLNELSEAVDIPIVGIGGITADNMKELKGRGIKGVALVSSVFAADDIRKECIRLKKIVHDVVFC